MLSFYQGKKHKLYISTCKHLLSSAYLSFNSLKFVDESGGYQISGIAFKTNKGTEYDNVESQSTEKSDRLQKCQDWEMICDEDNSPVTFPTVIVVTEKHPDVTMYSIAENKCVVTELTVSAEENFAQGNSRKVQVCWSHTRVPGSRLGSEILPSWSWVKRVHQPKPQKLFQIPGPV